MRIHQTGAFGALLAGCLMAGSALAEIAGIEFSADMVMRGPDGQTSSGKMYVGTNRMRVEMAHQGQSMIRIVDQSRGMEWMIFPERRAYMERSLPMPAPAAGQVPVLPSAETNPCQGIANLNCRRVGEEDIGGRRAVKWEMTMNQGGQTLTGFQWLDAERGMPLKYQMPNGQSMELRILGIESVAGRRVEKWEMTMFAPNEQPVRTYQWYDPELKLAVRQEMPGGFIQELTNIQVAPQREDLFQVPAGYTRMESPPAPPR